MDSSISLPYRDRPYPEDWTTNPGYANVGPDTEASILQKKFQHGNFFDDISI